MIHAVGLLEGKERDADEFRRWSIEPSARFRQQVRHGAQLGGHASAVAGSRWRGDVRCLRDHVDPVARIVLPGAQNPPVEIDGVELCVGEHVIDAIGNGPGARVVGGVFRKQCCESLLPACDGGWGIVRYVVGDERLAEGAEFLGQSEQVGRGGTGRGLRVSGGEECETEDAGGDEAAYAGHVGPGRGVAGVVPKIRSVTYSRSCGPRRILESFCTA